VIWPTGPSTQLTPIKQKGGKIVYAWAFKGYCDPNAINCNSRTIQWPPHSGQQMEIPEIDRVEFFELATAKKKIKVEQERVD
jgi:predicted NUDIX family NTP pyrophosphohydrolase